MSMPSTVEICANSEASAVGSAGLVGVWYFICAVRSCRKSDWDSEAAEPDPAEEVPAFAAVVEAEVAAAVVELGMARLVIRLPGCWR